MNLEFQKQDIFYLYDSKLADARFEVADWTIAGSNLHKESYLMLASSQPW